MRVLRDVHAAGIDIRPDPPDLLVEPADRLTPELEARLRRHKAEILWRLELERRLVSSGISIAIDKTTGAALLIFSESDAAAVCNVADIHKPFAVQLTDRQRRELTNDLDYYEGLLKRKGQPSNASNGT